MKKAKKVTVSIKILILYVFIHLGEMQRSSVVVNYFFTALVSGNNI